MDKKFIFIVFLIGIGLIVKTTQKKLNFMKKK